MSEELTALLQKEKLARQTGDFKTAGDIARSIVKFCFEHNDFKNLSNSLTMLSKRRGQEKQVVQAAVQETMEHLATIKDIDTKKDLIITLRAITEGKIFFELERASLTSELASILEKNGQLKEASIVMQEIQVETLGKMDKRGRAEFLLEQIRLCLDSNDYIRTQILSRKVSTKVLQEADFQDLKLRFYDLMIRYYSHENEYLQICTAYEAIYNTPLVKENSLKLNNTLKMICLFAVLSKHSPEQSDILLRYYDDKHITELPLYKQLLKDFIQMELIHWTEVEKNYQSDFSTLSPFKANNNEQLWKDLRLRVVEHNIRVISQCYGRIHVDRFSELLELSTTESEQYLAENVTSKAVYAKIDRPKGIISFVKPQQAEQVLNDWSEKISSLLDLLEKTNHLIQRERMVHGVQESS